MGADSGGLRKLRWVGSDCGPRSSGFLKCVLARRRGYHAARQAGLRAHERSQRLQPAPNPLVAAFPLGGNLASAVVHYFVCCVSLCSCLKTERHNAPVKCGMAPGHRSHKSAISRTMLGDLRVCSSCLALPAEGSQIRQVSQWTPCTKSGTLWSSIQS